MATGTDVDSLATPVFAMTSVAQAIAQLMRRVRMTESFTQFTFRMLDGYLESVEIALNMDSLWDMIGAESPDNPDRRT